MEELVNCNPYERQLYALFKSFDVNKNECLDKKELSLLCDALELDEVRKLSLLNALSHVNEVSFGLFKEALLNILDGSSSKNNLIVEEDDISREPSPDREVSPKFVYGEKKYGRRSRPETGEQTISEKSESEDFTHCDAFPSLTTVTQQSHPINISMFKNSRNQDFESEILNQTEMELRAAWEKLGISTDGFIQQSHFNSMCHALGFSSLSQQEVQDLFKKLDTDRDGQISFTELMQLLRKCNSQPTVTPTPLSPETSHQDFSRRSDFTGVDLSSPGVVSIDVLLELWETAGVPNASSLLQDLGLSRKSEVNVTQLSVMLDEELTTIQRCESSATYSPHVTLLIASLALSQFQIKMYRCCLDQMERSQEKLRADLNSANQRATLLAQEVDDHHARIEKTTQQQIKLLEQKHAEQMKQLSLQLLNEREQLREQSIKLETKLEKSQEEESKLKSDLLLLQNDYCQMEKENQSLLDSLGEKEKLSSQVEVQAQEIETLHERVHELEDSNQQVLSLIEKLNQLQTENAMLRDRNDELTVEIESANRRQLSGTKRRGNNSTCTPKEDGDSPRLGKVRRYTTHNDLSLETTQMKGLAIEPLHTEEGGIEVEFDDSVIFNSSCEVDSVENNRSSSDDEVEGKTMQHSYNSLEIIEENKLLRMQLKEIRSTLEECCIKLSREFFHENEQLEEITAKKCEIITDIWEENKYLKRQLEEIKLTLNECQIKLAVFTESKSEEMQCENLDDCKEKMEEQLLQTREVLNLLQVLSGKSAASRAFCITDKEHLMDRKENFKETCKELDQNLSLKINLNDVQSEISKIIAENKTYKQENYALKSQKSNFLTKLSNKEENIWNISHDSSLKSSSQTDNNLSSSTLSSSFTDLSNYAFDFPAKQILDEGKFCSLDSLKLNKNNLNLTTKRSEVEAVKTNSNISNNLMASIPKDKTIYVNNLEAELLNKNYKNIETSYSGVNESVQLFMNKILHEADDKSNSPNYSLDSSLKCNYEIGNNAPLWNHDKLRDSFQSPLKLWKLATLEAFFQERDDLLLKCSKMEELSKEKVELTESLTKCQNEIQGKEEQIAKLTEKCETLEKGIELLKDEYEECENYWNDKVDEERRLFEEEQRISNEKYAELESKIQEYATFFSNPIEETNNLPTIEERGELEKQFIDLEEEFELYKKRSMMELEEKDIELMHYKDLLASHSNTEKSNAAVQVDVCEYFNSCASNDKNVLEESHSSNSAVPKIPVSFPTDECTLSTGKLKQEYKQLYSECRTLKQKRNDLLRQLSNFRRNNVAYSNPHEPYLLSTVSSKLHQTEMKCRHLQSALKHQKRQYGNMLNAVWEEHKEALQQVRTTLRSSQEKLSEQLLLTRQQMERLKNSDKIAADLYFENAELMAILRSKQFCSCSVVSLPNRNPE